MAADGSIKIDTKIDTSGVNKGVNDVYGKLDSLSKKAAKLAVGGAVFTAATAAAKKAAEAIKDVTDASNKQVKAEKQLEVAAKNNPYLNSESVRNLKNYAGQLQSVTAVGDEELLPFMAELAAAGRSETEIQEIMSAAIDASASGTISLDSAVQSLNRSYSGEVGMLSRILPDVKNLTTEQLKSGEAVKLVKNSYNGMAEELANGVNSQQKLNNAIGDFKETVGYSFNKALQPVNNFFARIIQGWADARKAKQDYDDAVRQNGQGKGNKASLQTELDGLNESIATLEARLNATNPLWKTIKKAVGIDEADLSSLKAYKKRVEEINAQLKAIEEEEAVIAKQTKDTETANANMDQRDKLRESYNETIKNKEREIDARKRAGEQITKEQEAQELYNTALEAYIAMYSDPAFDRSQTKTGIWAGEAEQLQQMAEWLEASKTIIEESQWDKFTNKLKEIKDEFSEIGDAFTNFSDLMSQTADLMADEASAEEEYKLAQLESDYNKGLKSYEQYQNEKTEIEQKAAKKTYEIELYQWGLQLAQATANTALGVANALANSGNPYVGIAMAAVTAALGAAQVASIIAAKPTEPHFRTGGIVGGNSYNDGVSAKLSTGEMVLNKQQQRTLWELANGRGAGGTVLNVPITVENSAADVASASASYDGEAIRLMITRQVQNDMANGTYNKQFQIMQNNINGKRYI